MAQPPQNYDLSGFSTTLVLCVAAVFFWLCTKLIVGIVKWVFGYEDARATEAKVIHVEEEEEDQEEEDKEELKELPELDTKKGN